MVKSPTQKEELEYSRVLHNRISELEQRNNELAAQVEQLRGAGNEVYAELQQWALSESHEETNRVFELWLKVRNKTPAQCLAERYVEVAVIGFLDGYREALHQLYGTEASEISMKYHADRYANQLRQQAKPKTGTWLKDSNTHCNSKGGE